MLFRFCIPVFYRPLIIACLLGPSLFGISASSNASNNPSAGLDTGYSALRLFLKDEQHLTTIRRIKLILAFEGISDKSEKLVDEIADSSAQALEQLDQLVAMKPAIRLEDFSDDSIAKSTLDSLRMATAKEFLLETDDFEKDLLLSQSQILRVISHLARELEEKESNSKRKAWLNKLAQRYEKYYQQVYARITVVGKGRA